MLLSQSSQYAISGVLRLAALPEGGFCRLDDLVVGTAAPRPAVAKVFNELTKRGVLQSVRGAGGGFKLSRHARRLTLLQIIEAVDGPWDSAAVSHRGLCLSDHCCALSNLLQPISTELEQVLRTTTVESLVHMFPQDAANCCPKTCHSKSAKSAKRKSPLPRAEAKS